MSQEEGGDLGWPWLDARCPRRLLYHSPPQLDKGEKM